MAKGLDYLKSKDLIKSLRLFLLLQIVFSVSWFSEATTFAGCIHAGWIPYKNVKCFKILNLYQTHSEAISSCQKQLLFDDLIETNIPASLMTIYSREEEEFVDKLLFNVSKFADNVWLGAVRDGQRAQFKWLDGTSLNNISIYNKWAFGYPNGDFSKNCVELRAKEIHSTHVPGPFAQDPSSWWSSSSETQTPTKPPIGPEPGNWYNVPCSKHNLVVCETSQTVPERVIHYQLARAKSEIRALKEELLELKKVVSELAANVVTDIRLGSKETTDIWRGAGFADGTGYVITGVVNWDGNDSVDTVHRRRMEKYINGQWYDVY